MKQFLLIALFACAISGFAQRNNNNSQVATQKQRTSTVNNTSAQQKAATKHSNTTPQQNAIVDYDDNAKAIVYGDKSYKLLFVGAGIFTIGDYDSQVGFEGDMVCHRVALSSYCLGQTEVTQGLWKAVMGNNPSKFKGENLPVENVSWEDCQLFLKKLKALTGKDFCLPTEAEWEFAARGGNLHTKKQDIQVEMRQRLYRGLIRTLEGKHMLSLKSNATNYISLI